MNVGYTHFKRCEPIKIIIMGVVSLRSLPKVYPVSIAGLGIRTWSDFTGMMLYCFQSTYRLRWRGVEPERGWCSFKMDSFVV